MTDFNAIRVIPFCGKVDEWHIWNEKFLTKAKRFGCKDLLLGNLSIPKVNESSPKGCKSKDYLCWKYPFLSIL
jgi:hypothetical protein